MATINTDIRDISWKQCMPNRQKPHPNEALYIIILLYSKAPGYTAFYRLSTHLPFSDFAGVPRMRRRGFAELITSCLLSLGIRTGWTGGWRGGLRHTRVGTVPKCFRMVMKCDPQKYQWWCWKKMEKTRLFNWRSKFRALCEGIFHFVDASLEGWMSSAWDNEVLNYHTNPRECCFMKHA